MAAGSGRLSIQTRTAKRVTRIPQPPRAALCGGEMGAAGIERDPAEPGDRLPALLLIQESVSPTASTHWKPGLTHTRSWVTLFNSCLSEISLIASYVLG
jgi:hypothetical protein